MNELCELGIEGKKINNILEICPNVKDLTNEEIRNKISILESLKCEKQDIKNIVEANPEYLLRVDCDVLNMINKLLSLGIERVDITIESNPWVLNKDAFEIDDYIENKKKDGLTIEDTIDLIDSGMME